MLEEATELWNDQSQSRKFGLGMHVLERSVDGVSQEEFHKITLRLCVVSLPGDTEC